MNDRQTWDAKSLAFTRSLSPWHSAALCPRLISGFNVSSLFPSSHTSYSFLCPVPDDDGLAAAVDLCGPLFFAGHSPSGGGSPEARPGCHSEEGVTPRPVPTEERVDMELSIRGRGKTCTGSL